MEEVKHEELKCTVEFISRVLSLPEEKQKILYRALSWYERGCQSKTEDQFISWGISFESLLGLLGKEIFFKKLDPGIS